MDESSYNYFAAITIKTTRYQVLLLLSLPRDIFLFCIIGIPILFSLMKRISWAGRLVLHVKCYWS
jgi:hypothetical protein